MHLPVPLCPSSKRVLATLALLAISSLAAHAVVLVNSDFDGGYTSGGNLAGQSGTGDVGLSGTYTGSSTGNGVTVRDAGFVSINTTYNVSGGGTIQGGSHYVLLESNTGSTAYTRNLSESLGGQTLYARVVLTPKAGFNPSAYMLFSLDAVTTPGAGTGAVVGVAPNGGQAVGASALNNNFSAIPGGTLANDTPYLLVARFNWTGSGYTSIDTWLNPTATDQVSPDASAAVTSYNPSFISISLTLLNSNPGVYFGMDSFAVGTAWEDVVAVPETSASSLLAGGCVALLFSRRRRPCPKTALPKDSIAGNQ